MVRQPDMDAISRWERLEWEELPIYVCPDLPDWFVPNEAADRGLRRLRATGKADRELRRLLKRIDAPSEQPYQSRSERLRLDGLKECWMHITNRCNLKCRHCLFSCTTKSTDELSPAACARIIDEAYELGCRLFFLTGGEPLLASAFTPSLRRILNRPDTHVVILTNLSLLSEKEDFLRTLPRDRVHFQVGMDGLEANHEALRGRRAFRQLSGNLDLLGNLGFPATLAMTVTKDNVADMPGLIDYAARMQVANVHYLWLFQKGNADASLFADPDRIFTFLIAAQERAEAAGVKIDNVEILRSQVFSFPGTRYDLSNAGWQSLTVGPDGHVYPTPALVYTDGMRCGPADAGLRRVWEESAVLREVRNTSLHHSAVWRQEPLRYLIGGGDIDHSYVHSGRIAGDDPYTGLYVRIAKWLIVRAARRGGTDGYPAFRLKMGEKLGDCVTSGGDIFFTHSNCVLTLPGRDHHVQVNNFYRAAAEQVQTDILNPLAYEEELVDHIPEEMRYRSYGCGSPVREAGIRPGETVVDLGCGTGIECFIAARLTGERGRIIGIDMGEAMLARAENARLRVAEKLGYDNVVFKKAFLEDLPLGDDSADLVLSNCVLNLSPDKRRGFQEIYRVLKPGGRIVIADITHDQNLPLGLRYNEKLRGECIGGALRYQDLFGLINDLGLSRTAIVAGYLYRTVQGCDFYSVTYTAVKPVAGERPVLYDFPAFAEVMAQVRTEPACTCFHRPNTQNAGAAVRNMAMKNEPHRSGCLVCGAEIAYLADHRSLACHYCGRSVPANACCTERHFVCDECHRADAVDVIRQVCLNSREPDAVALMETIRSHPRFRVHGPEHHPLVPAVILTALRNGGNEVTEEQIAAAIERGQTIAGGACAFLGACGAAIGVGIAFSVLTAANPYDGDKRQAVQQATQEALGKIASFNAPRCCQRDSWLALQAAAEIMGKMLGKTLMVRHRLGCKQYLQNKECIFSRCPLWSPGHGGRARDI